LQVNTLQDVPLTQLLADAQMAASGKQIKDALMRGAVLVNGDVKTMEDNMRAAEVFAVENAFFGRFFLVKLGKKKNHLFSFA
jgi:tyrosyl-tRNA synthetase